MHRFRHLRSIIACGIIQRQSCETISDTIRYEISSGLRALSVTACVCADREPTAKALRSTKSKSKSDILQYFVDIKPVRKLLMLWDIINL